VRARVLVALDLLSWLDKRGQGLRDLTQADLDRWLTDGTSTRRAVRYFLHWAHGRGHIHQLDRCLADEAMPLDLRVGGALVLLFGMLVSRITQLTKDDVIEDNRATWLAIDGHRLMLPARLARFVRQLRDQDEPRWTLGRLGTPAPWLFPGQSPDRPAVDVLFGARLRQYGINAHAGRNTARLALAAELPAAVLADLTGISVSTAERWSHWAKRDWAAYVGQRTADDRGRHRQQPETY
jgi:integrase